MAGILNVGGKILAGKYGGNILAGKYGGKL